MAGSVAYCITAPISSDEGHTSRRKTGWPSLPVPSGSVVMSPWGSEQSSGPEGGANFGQYKPGINGGALVMRYGQNGTEELVGRSKKFTATKSATLFFFMAMQPNFAGGGYQFPGSYKVKVKISPQ